MRRMLLIERMAEAEIHMRWAPLRLVWRDCTPKGLSSRSFTIVERDLTRRDARILFERERPAKVRQPVQQPQPVAT